MLESAHYGLPFKKQRTVSSDTTLSTQDLGVLLSVDSTGGPVTITLPRANTVRGGAVFRILALRGSVNPVTVTVAAGDSYNEGLVAPIALTADAQILDAFATESSSAWTLGFHISAPNPPGDVQTTFVFQPGGVASANVYTSWPALIADHALVQGPTIIELDDRFGAITIPAGGPYDMRDTLIQGRLLSGTPVVATITDGATFVNLERLMWASFSYAGASPAVVVPTGLSYFRMWGGNIQNSGAPFFDVTTPGAILLSQFENAAGFNPFPGTPVVDLGSTGFFSFGLDEATSNGTDTVTGSAGSIITVAIRDPSARYIPITGPTFTGALSVTIVSIAENVEYDDSLVTPALGAVTVQTAIDALKNPIATVGLAADQALPGGALASWALAASLDPLDPTAYALGTDSLGVDYVEVLRAGNYMVHISAEADHGPGTSRSEAIHTLFLDALATEVYTIVPFSEMATYHRNVTAGRDGDANTVALTLPAGARLTGGSIRTAGAATISLQSEGCNITLQKVSP